MKIQKPAETVDVCDICHREGYLLTCIVCGGSYCLVHKAIIPACWHQPRVCEKCAERDDVRAIVDRHTEQLTPIFEAREAALAGLREEAT